MHSAQAQGTRRHRESQSGTAPKLRRASWLSAESLERTGQIIETVTPVEARPSVQAKVLRGPTGAGLEFERELIRTRTGEGRERAKARGQSLGRPFKLTPHQRSEAIRRRDRANRYRHRPHLQRPPEHDFSAHRVTRSCLLSRIRHMLTGSGARAGKWLMAGGERFELVR